MLGRTRVREVAFKYHHAQLQRKRTAIAHVGKIVPLDARLFQEVSSLVIHNGRQAGFRRVKRA